MAQLAHVTFVESNTVYACDPHPHMPSGSLSVFLTVESPVMNTTGLPFSRFTATVGSSTLCIMACSGARAGSVLAAMPSAAERAFISAPNLLVCMWSL